MITVFLFLAFAGERVIEYFVSPVLDVVVEDNKKIRTLVFSTLGLVLGIAVAIGFNIRIVHEIGATGGEYVDMVLSGALIGCGYEIAHELVNRFFPDTDIE